MIEEDIIKRHRKEINFIRDSFNVTDYRIIHILYLDNPQPFKKGDISVADIGRVLSIAGVNVWKHLNKLEKMNVIFIPKVDRGKKKFPYLKKTELTEALIKIIRLMK